MARVTMEKGRKETADLEIEMEPGPEEFDPKTGELTDGKSGYWKAEKRGEEGKGAKEEPKGMSSKTTKRTKRNKRGRNPRSGSPDSGFNFTKILLVAGAGALVWDFMTNGGLLGVFGPQGLFGSLFSGQNTVPNAAIPPQTGGNTATQPANGVNTAPPPAATTPPPPAPPQTPPAPLVTPFERHLQEVQTQNTDNLQRDVDKFNGDQRFQTSMLVRGSQGYAYGVLILRRTGKRFNWDQWNWYRGQQGGTPIDIDALGLANKRGTDIGIDEFLATAGIDPIEAREGAGMSGLPQHPIRDYSWLM